MSGNRRGLGIQFLLVVQGRLTDAYFLEFSMLINLAEIYLQGRVTSQRCHWRRLTYNSMFLGIVMILTGSKPGSVDGQSRPFCQRNRWIL